MTDREEHDIEGLSTEEMSEQIISGLLECRDCERTNGGIENISHGMGPNGVEIRVAYVCEFCGTDNRNTAVIS